jgi:uncharacterized damage-inducible protein DinB
MTTEQWLSGPVAGVPPLLMPAAHALLQVRGDVRDALEGLSPEQIWARPGASASIGFHAMHLAGATERLMTYAAGRQLSGDQLIDARAEKDLDGVASADIVARVERAIDAALAQIRATDSATLSESREVGRQRLPSNVLGLIFHAAEHAARHAGQIATLRKVVTSRQTATTS